MAGFGGLDLLVNNASTLGRLRCPFFSAYPVEALRASFEVNVVAPGAVQDLAPWLDKSRDPRILNVTSDASVEHYETWGGYGSTKAALDHLTLTLAAEQPTWRCWAVDPATCGRPCIKRPSPGRTSRPTVPQIGRSPADGAYRRESPSGRYRAAELAGDDRVPQPSAHAPPARPAPGGPPS